MNRSALAAGVRQIRGTIAAQRRCEDSDEQLLHAFADHRDETAFAALVRRHGPMVMGVCRRVLRHTQDAEDAFQATFLVLAQNADTLRDRTALAGFLHGTAYRLAVMAIRSAARRRKHERQAPVRSTNNPSGELLWREVQTLLDEEIARLPDTYRSVFVLCCLEGLSYGEAARRLGVKEVTVTSRLAGARKRLQKRLSRHGVELTALLTATALTIEPASAQSAALLVRMSRAAISPAAAALADGGIRALSGGKIKMMLLLLLTAGVAAGAGWWQAHEQIAPAETPPVASKADPAAKTVQVRGRVLDPDGKPVAGARLYSPRFLNFPPLCKTDFTVVPRGVSDADGRFRVELPRSDVPAEGRSYFIAAADGFGVDWAELSAGVSPIDLTLRLVKDQLIQGRILNTEGKPVAGARVSAVTLYTTPEGKLDGFLNAWRQQWQNAIGHTAKQLSLPLDKILPSAPTDKEGRFRLTGIGAERVALLWVKGPDIAHGSLLIVGRAGFDPAPLNKAVLERIPPEARLPGQPPRLYGPSLDYVASAVRLIEGTVREAGSGKPVAGITVSASIASGFDDSCTTVSDEQGRYRLAGLPKLKEVLVHTRPEPGSTWLPSGARVRDREGLQPLQVDLTIARGVAVAGRVIDRTTGKGVQCLVRFIPLPANKFFGKPGYDSYHYSRGGSVTDAKGRFRLVVLPGPGVLMAQAAPVKASGGQLLNPYKLAEFDAGDREHVRVFSSAGIRHFATAGGSTEGLDAGHAVKYLDLAPNAGPVHADLFVDRGKTLAVNIQDAEGKPLTGTTAAGVTASPPNVFDISEARLTVYALDPKQPRRLAFYHAGRGLAGMMTVRGDEKEPPAARLVRAGTVTGRLLDLDGQPIASADIELSFVDSAARELYRQLSRGRPPIRTGKDGRFRIAGLFPGVKFDFGLRQGRVLLIGEPRIGLREVKPGETLDLGDIHTKPQR